MKICPKCGVQNTDTAKFCGNCGEDLRQVQPVVPPQPTPEPQKQTRGWTPPQPQPQPPEQKPKKKPLPKLSKRLILPLVECAALIIAIVVFCAVGNSRTDPAKVAVRYIQALADGDWETICAVADVPESPFLTEEAFQTALESWDPFSGGTLAQVSAETQTGTNSLTDYVREVDVEYLLKGSSTVHSTELSLVKGESKEMFFFTGWKIADSLPFVAENYQVMVPAGATLVVDGLVADETLLLIQTETTDTYIMDLFVGEHSFTVITQFGSDSWSKSIWSNDDYVSATGLSLSEENQTLLLAQTKDVLEEILTAALAQASVDTLSMQGAENLEESYETLVQRLFPSDNRRALAVTLSDFSLLDSYIYQEDGEVYVDLYLTYEAECEFANLNNGYYQDSYNTGDYFFFGITYRYDNGTWTPSIVGSISVS